MGQSVGKTEDLADFKNLNSGLKDYLFLNNKDVKTVSIFKNNKNLRIQRRTSLNNDELVILSLSLAIKVKENLQ